MNQARQRRGVDWCGAVFTIAFAAWVLLRSSALGALLLPTVLHEGLIAVSFLIRGAPKRKLGGIAARIATYGASFIVPLYCAALGRSGYLISIGAPLPFRKASLFIWLAGGILGVWSVWHLRHSFSFEPQARQLVTSGPYKFIRHPVYTAYLLQYVGIYLVRPSVSFGLVVIAWFFLMTVRVRLEERVLTQAFPEYSEYRMRAGRFAPLFRKTPAYPSIELNEQHPSEIRPTNQLARNQEVL